MVLSGCFTREGTIVGGKVHGGSNSIDGKYKSFTGFATQDMDVKKGESWTFTFDEKSGKSEISLYYKTKQRNQKGYVLDSDDNTILEVNSGNSKNNIKVSKDDTYKVKIITEEHGGEFEMSWKKEK